MSEEPEQIEASGGFSPGSPRAPTRRSYADAHRFSLDDPPICLGVCNIGLTRVGFRDCELDPEIETVG